MTSIGKYRHLTRAATPAGHFVILAIDHRANLRQKLDALAARPLSDGDFAAFKQEITTALAPYVSAVLTDPTYGLGPGIATRTLPGAVGLLAPLEVTDYGLHPSQRSVQFIPDWSVYQAKLAGVDGVKLLLPYHPQHERATQARDTVAQIVEDCRRYELPFYLEPIPFSLDPATPLADAAYLQICIDMCETFSALGVDVLKVPFPLPFHDDALGTGNIDTTSWPDACAAINRACTVPWALLSAGVRFDVFALQARIACAAGASGVIVGRAVWSGAISKQGRDRSQFIQQRATQRIQQLAQICADNATPWYDRVQAADATHS